MSILSITPGEALVEAGGHTAQAPAKLETEEAVNITADNDGAAFPTLANGEEPDYYMLTTNGAMHVKFKASETNAEGVAAADTLLPSGTILFLGAKDLVGLFAAKLDI